MKKIWLAVILTAILTAVPAHASLREALEKLRAENQHRQSLVVSEHTEELKEQDEYPYQEQDAGTFDETVQEDGQIDDTLEQRQTNTTPENAVLQEQFDKIWRDTQDSDALRRRMMQPDFYDASKNKRPIGESVENAVIILIVTILSIGYLLWIRRLLKSKAAKSVPREIFRDAATVAGLLLALALFSKMVYDSSDAGHFRSAMFIAVSSAVLPYLCMMYLADGYRRPYPWRAKILYPQTAAILAYWMMLYAADIADGEGSGNVMASLFGLLLSTAFCIALKIKLAKSKNQQD
ncbi:hypothetical protein [Neisseria elongata]|uniref:hypothetical protein n=1 Tax=Neisseria elongata TaxID=495 RepID=UPI00195E8377|nr:hypothetical protein [Neisseria elongata]MBM7064298.1 hypothetical protein [Neisseria elongata]